MENDFPAKICNLVRIYINLCRVWSIDDRLIDSDNIHPSYSDDLTMTRGHTNRLRTKAFLFRKVHA